MSGVADFFVKYWPYFVVGAAGVVTGIIFTVVTKALTNKKQWEGKKERSLFAKVAIVVLFSLMAVLTIISFLVSEEKFVITNGIVYILGLMILLLISDSVETFSLGSLLTLKKEVKSKEEEVEKLTNDNSELRAQMVSVMSASITNQNRNQVFLGIGEAWLKNVKVEQVTKDDSENNSPKESEEEKQPQNSDSGSTRTEAMIERHEFHRFLEKDIIQKFAAKNEIDSTMVQCDVKFSEQLSDGDPIMNQTQLFDAYLKRPLEELFIEVVNGIQSGSMYYRIYYMTSLVLRYAQINNKSAKLILLMPKFDRDWLLEFYGAMRANREDREIERFQRIFQPAIKNGFLEMKFIEYSEDECNNIISLIKKTQGG